MPERLDRVNVALSSGDVTSSLHRVALTDAPISASASPQPGGVPTASPQPGGVPTGGRVNIMSALAWPG
jgi:hypothetical protein